MTRLIALLMVIALSTGCTHAEPRPGRVEKHTLPDGREVLMYVPGYSIEDFLCEFYRTVEFCED